MDMIDRLFLVLFLQSALVSLGLLLVGVGYLRHAPVSTCDLITRCGRRKTGRP